MTAFADMTGLDIRLIYYPPYHSKYNSIERYWAGLEKSWNGCGEGLWFVINQINGEKGISYSKALELIRKEALLSEEPKKEWMY